MNIAWCILVDISTLYMAWQVRQNSLSKLKLYGHTIYSNNLHKVAWTLRKMTFYINPYLGFLTLQNNPLMCNSSWCWVRQAEHDWITLKQSGGMICAGPGNLTGQIWNLISTPDLCPGRNEGVRPSLGGGKRRPPWSRRSLWSGNGEQENSQWGCQGCSTTGGWDDMVCLHNRQGRERSGNMKIAENFSSPHALPIFLVEKPLNRTNHKISHLRKPVMATLKGCSKSTIQE